MNIAKPLGAAYRRVKRLVSRALSGDEVLPCPFEPLEQRILMSDTQIVAPSMTDIHIAPDSRFSFDLVYTTDDRAGTNPPAENNTLTGLGIRMHFDSSVLTLEPFEEFFDTNLAAVQVQDDVNDYDNDPSTDKLFSAFWFDLLGRWPGTDIELPLALYAPIFSVAEGFEGQTSINFTSSTLAAGHELDATSAVVRVDPDAPVDEAPAEDTPADEGAASTDDRGVDVLDRDWPSYRIRSEGFGPRNSPLDQIDIKFRVPVSNVALDDFVLTRRGDHVDLLPGSPVTLSTTDGGETWHISNLSSVANDEGFYLLAFNANDSEIVDANGLGPNLDSGAAWTIDRTRPVATDVEVEHPWSIELRFSESMKRGDASLLAAGRDGTFGTSDDETYDIASSRLGGETLRLYTRDSLRDGKYRVVLSEGFTDRAGNALEQSALEFEAEGMPYRPYASELQNAFFAWSQLLNDLALPTDPGLSDRFAVFNDLLDASLGGETIDIFSLLSDDDDGDRKANTLLLDPLSLVRIV